MGDLHFEDGVPLTLAALAARAGFTLPDGIEWDRPLARATALALAGPADLAVAGDGCDLDDLAATRAAVCFVPAHLAAQVPPTTVAVVCEQPQETFDRAVAILLPRVGKVAGGARSSIDARAHVDPLAHLEAGVTVGPFAAVGAGAEIGAGTTIGLSCAIGPGVRIGRDCAIGSHVSIANALVGDRVVIHPGSRLGMDAGPSALRSLGRVIVQDGVEVGTNSVIERGRLRDTVIGDRATIAPLVLVRGETTVERCDRVGFSSAVEMV